MKLRAVGIAGYMGAGKSSAARILARRLNAPIIDADAEAKRLMRDDTNLHARLAAAFGPAVIEGGALSFRALGARAFSSIDELERLNRIAHPPLLQRLSQAVKSMQGGCYILDAALIPLWGIESWFDTALWIDVPREIRLARLCGTTSLSPEELTHRCAVQELLFAPPPAGSPWRIVDNSGAMQHLTERLASLA